MSERNLTISDLEKEIIRHISEGKGNREIALLVNLSAGTTRNYISLLLSRYECRNRTELAMLFMKGRDNARN